jgi:hypothetical protein
VKAFLLGFRGKGKEMNIEASIQDSNYPEYIKDYILQTYEENHELFLAELRKAENNSKRPGIENKKYNLWIAANNAYLKEEAKFKSGLFECYYCRLDLTTISPEDVRFEHFIPKIQITTNIVQACKWCDKIKRDRMPEDFENIILNEDNVINDIYAKTNEAREKLIEFAPLVACHSMGNSNPIWINKMIEIANKKYGTDLSSLHQGQVRWRYYELFRRKWYQN